MKRKKTYNVQTHHLEFQRKDKVAEKQGETVRLFQGEHWTITQMQRRKRVSKGFLKALEFFIDSSKDKAVELL